MDIRLRSITAEEWPRFYSLMSEVFAEDETPEDVEHSRQTAELDRSVAAFDGDELVGTSGVYSLRMRVPGGVLPTAGVTWVTVRSTHRRQGILTSMMRRMLDGARERGEPLGALWAAESQIYGRFGFGMANHLSTFQIDARHARMVTPPPRGRCRLVTAEQAAELLPPVYERALDHPGMLERSKVWWGRRLYDSAGGRAGGWSRRRVAVYERDGAIEGYVLFRVKGDWGDFPDNKLRVGELVATDADARAGLWSYIFGIDLVTGIEAGFRPSDDPLHFMLADPRRLRTGNVDGLWVRVLDVPAALEGRRYLGSGRVRFGLEDPFLPENSGTYELEAADGVGACRRVDAEPELRLRADALGAIYTGDFSPVQLAGAGQVEELRQGAALELHRILSWPVRTYCPEVF